MTTEEQFTAAALRRIYLAMALLGVAGTVLVLLWKGWWFAAGFAAGAALSWLNFHWLKGAVDMLATLAGRTGAPTAPAPGAVGWRNAGPTPRPPRVAARLVLRYALMGGLAYAIFRTSLVSLAAFLVGLFVFVAAVLAEMIYELAQGIPNA